MLSETLPQGLQEERRRDERLALISRIGRAIAADLPLEELLRRAVDSVHVTLGCSYVAIALTDPRTPETLSIAAEAGAGADRRGRPIRAGDAIVGGVAASRERVLVADAAAGPRSHPEDNGRAIRSVLSVPLALGQRLLGVLTAESPRRLTEEDGTTLQAVADQLAVAAGSARHFEEARQALEEMRLLYRTSLRLGTAMNVDQVILAYLEQVADQTSCLCSVAIRETGSGGEPRSVVRGQWSPQTGPVLCCQPCSLEGTELGDLADAGQTVTIPDVRADPRVPESVRQWQVEAGCPALALIPLIVGGERVGVVALGYPGVFDWPEDVLQAYQATAAQLAAAIHSRQQHLLLVARGREIAVLEERHRLARDLHDSVTQLIFSVTLMAQSLQGAWRRDPEEADRRVGRLLELSSSALSEMRALLSDWRPNRRGEGDPAPHGRPTILEARQEGLVEALERHLAGAAVDGLKVSLDADGYAAQPPEVEEALLRITQEALGNVVKHAAATEAAVRLTADETGVRLTVTDNGRGFTRSGLRRGGAAGRPGSGGLGLSTMKERAEALGGLARVRPSPGRGTVVEVRLPRKEGQET